ASTFLKSGWATDSVMTCDACHTYTGSTGPHGSAMTVNIDPAYATSWKTAYLSGSSNGMKSTTVICAKCHDLNGASSSSAWSNQVHGESDHHGSSDGKCVLCHSQVPHGWKRPRMLAYTSDGAPYASTGLRAIRLANHTASGWSEHDCQTSCGEHDSSVSPVWPLVLDPDAPTTGGVAGKVTDSATGAAVSGATVSVAGKTATTASDGAYAISGIAGGTYTMTVSKTGYTTWSQPVTITNGVTLTQNVALVAGTGGTNLALGKSFTASHYESSAYAPGKAGDGSDSTFWWSNNTGGASTTEWLRVDLGTTYKIKETDIAWYGDYWAKEFRVYTSLNGSTWNQVYSTTTAPKGTSVVTFTARDARYVKVECRRTGTGRSTGYGIAELKVFQ
ncbi:MAG: discoidin domain-containing protein, partial [Coriobacteriales bacterium]